MKAQVQAEQRANEDAKLAARQRIDEMRKNVRTRAQIRKEEIEQLDRDRITLNLGQKDYDNLLAGINENTKTPRKRALAAASRSVTTRWPPCGLSSWPRSSTTSSWSPWVRPHQT